MPLQPTACEFVICDTSNTRKKNSKSKSKKFQKKFQKKNGLRALAPHRNRMRFQDTSLSACLVVLISLASVLPIILLQCVAVCCRALQWVITLVCVLHRKLCFGGVLQCGAVRCSVSQCVAVCCSALQCVAVCCSVSQCVAVWCSALQCVAVFGSVLQCAQV